MEEMKTLLPGREVKLSNGIVAVVYPTGFRHIVKFSQTFGTILKVASKLNAQAKPGSDLAHVIGIELMTACLSEVLELAQACVRFDPPNVKFDDLPHWEVPAILEAWVDLSFGSEEKVRPWIAAVTKLITAAKSSPWISGMLSKVSSPPATP